MDEEAPTGVRRRGPRRWLRRLLILCIVLPPATFGLSNLALGSPWARKWLAGKIHSRTTLDTTIDGASWSPWNGVTFRGVTLLQPEPLRGAVDEPLVRIRQLRVLPVWQTVLTKEPALRDVSLTEPRIVLPVEILSFLAAPQPPPVAMNTPAAEPSAATPPPAHPDLLAGNHAVEAPHLLPEISPNVSAAPEGSTTRLSPAAPPPATPGAPPVTTATAGDPDTAPPATPETPPPSSAPAASPPQAAQSVPGQFPTAYIRLEDASITLVLASAKASLLESSGITGKIPVAGDPAQSTLTIGSLSSLGNALLEKGTELTLGWKAPVITLEPKEEKIGGFNTRLACQLAVVPGIPIALSATVPDQPLPATPLPGGAIFQTPAASAELRFRGQLISPSTWQASLATAAKTPTVTAHGQETKFDGARSVTVLRDGALSCVDARIVGDHLSMLGNATVRSDGRTAGVLRIVAPPETTMSIVNQFFPGMQAPPAFSSMSTPQRVALDIEASGSLGDIQIRLGKNGPLVGQPKPPATATPP